MRRTISLPKATDDLVRESRRDDESYSAALRRLVEAGVRAAGSRRRPAWIGSGEGPTDLGRRVEHYLRAAARRRDAHR